MEQLRYSLKELCQVADVTERTVRYYIKEGLLPPPIGAGPFSRYSYEHWLRLQFIRRLKEEFLPLSEIKSLLGGKSLAELDSLARQSGLVASETPGFSADEVEETEVETDSRLESLVRPGMAANPTMLRQQITLNEAAAQYLPEIEEAEEAAAPVKPPRPATPFRIAPAPMPQAYSPPPPGAMNSVSGRAIPFQAASSQFGGASGINMRLGGQAESPMPSMSRRAAPPPTFIPNQEVEEIQGQPWERITIAPGIELHIESNLARKHRPALKTLLETARQLLEEGN